jgi:hypothetical protein
MSSKLLEDLFTTPPHILQVAAFKIRKYTGRTEYNYIE